MEKIKGYFQEKYFSEHYYERKMKEFFELKFGTMRMEEYEKQFLELMKYVDFMKDEKVKIQRFLCGLPLEPIGSHTSCGTIVKTTFSQTLVSFLSKSCTSSSYFWSRWKIP